MTKKLNDRQKYILHFIVNGEEISIDKLVRRLDVSRRTVQRNVSAIQVYLNSYNLSLRVSLTGIFVEGHPDDLSRMRKETGKLPSVLSLTAKDREARLVMDLLLEHGPMKLGYFGKQWNVTTASLSRDLDGAAAWLRAFGLRLIRRQGYGVEILGGEDTRREALAELIYDQVPLSDLMSMLRMEDTRETSHPLHTWFSKWFGTTQIEDVRRVLLEELTVLNPPLDEAAFYGFMLHVLLTCIRISHGASLPADATHEAVSSRERQICMRILQRILPDEPHLGGEASYLAKHLRGAKVLMTDDTRMLPLHITSMDLAYQIVKHLETDLGFPFVNDRDLLAAMAQHLEPAIHRMTTGLPIRNPLLDEIKHRYSTFFAAMQSASQHVLEPFGLQVPDAEVGYLTMHLGAAEERRRAQDTWRVQIVCPNGISSAALLASRINKEFPQVRIASIDSLHSVKDTTCDFIVSTVPFSSQTAPVVTVSPFLTKEDVYNIQGMFEQLRKSTASTIQAGEEIRRPQAHRMPTHAGLLSDRVRIECIEVGTMHDVINQIADDAVENGDAEDREVIYQAILQREQLGSIVLPGKRLSVLHARSNTLLRCQIAVYRLHQGITVPGVAGMQELVDTVLVLLAMVNERPTNIRLLGQLSSALVMDEDIVDALRTASIQDVQHRIQKAMCQIEEE